MHHLFSIKHPPKRALVIKLRHQGDVLLASPIFTVLKRKWPNIEVDALVYKDTKPMLTGHPYIDIIHTIGRNWRKKNWFVKFYLYNTLIKVLRARHYDILINLTEHWHGARLACCLKPRISVGMQPDKRSGLARFCWVKSFTTLYPAIQNNTRHMVEVNLDALRRIGIHPQRKEDKYTLFTPGKTAEISIIEKLSMLGIKRKSYILIHPTSRWMFKALSIRTLASVIDTLSLRGLPIVLSAASSLEEAEYMNKLCSLLTYSVYNFTGQLNLKELGALIKYARMYLGIDSMPTHLASAVGTPTVAIFGPTGAIKWRPWKISYRVITADFTCQPCGKAGCGNSGVSDCILAITPQQILSTIDAMLLETSS